MMRDLLAAAVKHHHDPIPSARKANPSVPTAVDGMVTKCLQKDPKDRYLSPQALLEDIHRVREAIRSDQPLNWSRCPIQGAPCRIRSRSSRSRGTANR